ncbi:MAG: hypothetical protein HPY79_09020 [Bacteroidales bacterium]|nr:hypothetical protein [Bacteroidales bacterium]
MAIVANIQLLTDYLRQINVDIHANNVILLYEGEVNHDIIKSLLITLEQRFKKSTLSRTIQKKIFNVMVECIQNIEKHTITFISENKEFYKRGSMLIIENQNEILIYSGNLVDKDQMSFLQQKQLLLKDKTKQQLRSMYKQQLIQGTISHKGGAGLGFIDMARKTDNQMDFYFFDINGNFFFFVNRIMIKK